MTAGLDEKKYALEAGRLCLEFANTLDWHGSDHPEETLHSYDGLLLWAQDRRVVGDQEAARQQERAAQEPELASQVYRQAIDLRDAVYRTFASLAAGAQPTPDDLDRLNAVLAQSLPHLRLVDTGGSFTWQWMDAGTALDRVIWDIALSASQLLTSPDLDRVRECADEHGCGWLFFDTTKNRSRRWCSMDGCGNRAKARRHYARQKSASQAGENN
jgi:predicted RNA-binding Zn ribbon-like protein